MTISRGCPIVGLVGGVGSGKSSLAQSLSERFGVVTIDGDAAGHHALAEKPVIASLRERFGTAIFRSEGTVNRQALAGFVFGESPQHEANRRFLEHLTHPWIRRHIEAEIAAGQSGGASAIILDAAILLETGWRSLCDYVIFVEADAGHRLARAERRGWTKDQWEQREASQMALAEKRRLSDGIVHNNGALVDALEELVQLLASYGVNFPERSLLASS